MVADLFFQLSWLSPCRVYEALPSVCTDGPVASLDVPTAVRLGSKNECAQIPGVGPHVVSYGTLPVFLLACIVFLLCGDGAGLS